MSLTGSRCYGHMTCGGGQARLPLGDRITERDQTTTASLKATGSERPHSTSLGEAAHTTVPMMSHSSQGRPHDCRTDVTPPAQARAHSKGLMSLTTVTMDSFSVPFLPPVFLITLVIARRATPACASFSLREQEGRRIGDEETRRRGEEEMRRGEEEKRR